jgi:hypothetical protein
VFIALINVVGTVPFFTKSKLNPHDLLKSLKIRFPNDIYGMDGVPGIKISPNPGAVA